MDNIEFEKLLSEHISVAEKMLGSDFEKNDYGDFYINKIYLNGDLYGMSFNFVTIMTNDKYIIQSIAIQLNEVINSDFYNVLIQKYGEPNNILVIKNRKLIGEGIHESPNFTQHLRRSTFELREGNFDENPLYLVWKKQNYQIKALLRHKQNMSEITFSIAED